MTLKKRPDIFLDRACTFCKLPIIWKRISDGGEVTCPCCGTYRISGSAAEVATHWDLPEEKWAALSYSIRRIAERAQPSTITSQTLAALRESAELPAPSEALDGLVVWFAKISPWPGAKFDITYPEFRAVIGAVDESAFDAYVGWVRETGWFDSTNSETSAGAAILQTSLTPAGWERYRELTSTGFGSRHAFMAMKFGDPELDSLLTQHFAPAIKEAGFDLRTVADGQAAGLIDDQIRVGIRTARFVVCDLTHGNQGAYWEAGFAEGLGKPVIYTCREDVFISPDKSVRPHFDTGHLATIVWSPENVLNAASRLKAMVRATLPGEANLEDT